MRGMTGPLLSASWGFDVPAFLNPVTQLHAREMVLPEEHADVIRGLAGKGGGGGNTYNITAMDSQSFHDFLRRNQGPLLKVLADASENRRKG